MCPCEKCVKNDLALCGERIDDVKLRELASSVLGGVYGHLFIRMNRFKIVQKFI